MIFLYVIELSSENYESNVLLKSLTQKIFQMNKNREFVLYAKH